MKLFWFSVAAIFAASCAFADGPVIQSGNYTKLLTQRGIMLSNGEIIENDGQTNLIKNGGCELDTQFWTASAGTFSTTTAAANVSTGVRSCQFNASASGQTVSNQLVNVVAGQASRLGYGECKFKTAATDYLLEVLVDSVVQGTVTIPATTSFAVSQTSTFTYPATAGTVQLRVKSQSDAAIIYWDQCAVREVVPTIFSGAQASGLTASRAIVTDASKNFSSSTTTDTEIGYVSGVTSAIQTQIDSKAPIADPVFTGSVTTPLSTTGPVLTDSGGLLSSSATLGKVYGGAGADMSSVTFPSSGTIESFTPNQYGVLLSGSAASGSVLAPDASTAKVLVSGGASANPAWSLLTNTNLSGSAAISNANLAQMNAHTFKGNNTGSAATPSDITATQLTAELSSFVGDSGSGGTKGLVPAPAAGDAAAGKVLTADGNWSPQASGFANPMLDVGDLIVGDTGGSAARLAGNTTTTKNFLTQTGDGVNSATQVWDTIDAGDLPNHSGNLITSGLVGTTVGGTGVNSTATFPSSGVVVTEAATETLTNKKLQDSTTTIIDDGDSTKVFKIQASGITTGTTRTMTVPDADFTAAGISIAQTFTNKTLVDSSTTIADDGDSTKKLAFQVSGVTTATTRTATVPDADFTMVGTATTQTLTNKTIAAGSNTLSWSVQSKNTAYTTVATDDLVLVDTNNGSADVTITMLAAASFVKPVKICKSTADQHKVIINRGGSDTFATPSATTATSGVAGITTATTTSLVGAGECVTIIGSGTTLYYLDHEVRSLSAIFSNGGSCAVVTQSTWWISAVSDPGTGGCGMTINTGVFNQTPACTCSPSDSGNSAFTCVVTAASATSVTVYTESSGSASDRAFQINCTGSR